MAAAALWSLRKTGERTPWMSPLDRGLATGLLSRVLHGAREAGYPTASLNVDTENPTGALGIYERAGFRQSYRQDFYHLDE